MTPQGSDGENHLGVLVQDGQRHTMVPRVLGAIACGACAVSAFVVPAVVRPSAQQGDASSRHTALRQAPLRMAVGGGGGGGGGEGTSQTRREVIAGDTPSENRPVLDVWVAGAQALRSFLLMFFSHESLTRTKRHM